MNIDRDGEAFCPLYLHAIELIGRRWSGAILRALTIHGTMRFSDITAAVPGLSDRLLSERLKELENEGIVVRTVIPQHPVRIHYQLSEKGQALEAVIASVADWAHDWLATPTGAEQSQCQTGDAEMGIPELHRVERESSRPGHPRDVLRVDNVRRPGDR